MGYLKHHNLDHYCRKYGLSVFIETGTAGGDSLRHASFFPFLECHSIEINEEQARIAQARFKDDDFITVHRGKSSDILNELLPSVADHHTVLFWLDAHFPGEMVGFGYGHEKDMAVRLPLESELRLIKELRADKRDVIIIDDLRIYEDGPFGNGNWKDRATLGGDSIDFIYELFGDTHQVVKDYAHEGYIILTPND